MQTTTIIEDNWQHVVGMMPQDFESSAYDLSAMARKRKIRSASDLLRLVFLYSLCDLPLDQTAARVKELGIGDLAGGSVLERLRKAGDWLGHLVLGFLQARGLGQGTPGLHVWVVDATTISVPGSKGTDWRVHMGLDLESSRITSVELTGPQGGETLVRHEAAPGRVFLGDRGYAHRRGVASVSQQGAYVVVRLNWQNFPLEDLAGEAVDLLSRAESLGPDGVGDFDVQFHHDDEVHQARLLIVRNSDEAAARAVQKATKAASKKGRKVSPDTVRAAHFTFVLTTLPRDRAPADQVMALYRLRWQIELVFKRLKGILNLDHLRAQNELTARAYLYGKLLAALVVDEAEHGALSFSPCGHPILRPADLALGSEGPAG
jgi:hypothetical protein